MISVKTQAFHQDWPRRLEPGPTQLDIVPEGSELVEKVVVQHAIEEWVGAGWGDSNQVTNKESEHNISWKRRKYFHDAENNMFQTAWH